MGWRPAPVCLRTSCRLPLLAWPLLVIGPACWGCFQGEILRL
uniref:Uncharacterized protein MANES_08G151700 n=1 Tax=Rhizophora mucronata TaxID=61149 RepID=A0A2P2KCH6_RHIMU